MIITKDNFKSRVHRPAYLDYIGFRTSTPDGPMQRERRFLGLFASSAYSEAVSRIPLLRQKAPEVLRRSGYDESSHGGKAIMDVLDTYPARRAVPDPGRRAGPVGGEGRASEGAPAGPAVRPPRRLRSLPVLPGLPAAGPLHHRGAQPDAGDVVAPARRRLDRLHRAGERVGPGPAALRPPDAGRGGDGRHRRPRRSSANSPWPPGPGTTSSPTCSPARGPGEARHPGRRPARGLQGGLHAKQGLLDLQALLGCRRVGDGDGHVPARPGRRRGRPAAQDLPQLRAAVAVQGHAPPVAAGRRRASTSARTSCSSAATTSGPSSTTSA